MRIFFILLRKEILQLTRDSSAFILALVLPVMMILLFGLCVNLDSSVTTVALVADDESPQAHQLIERLAGTPHIAAHYAASRHEAFELLQQGKVQGVVVVPVHASRTLAQNQGAELLIATDGTSPNTAQFTALYLQSIIASAQLPELAASPIDIRVTYLYNPAADSRHYIVPGAIALVLSMVGTFLTAMVVAREWERGTIEMLLSGAVSRGVFLLSKLIPYFILGLGAMLVCVLCAAFLLEVPVRGPLWLIFAIAGVFLLSVLSIGLLISTVVRNQYTASLISLMVAMLPSMLLSGFVFELSSMPALVQGISYFIPARYLCSSLSTLFLAGTGGAVLLLNGALLLVSALFWSLLVYFVTPCRLDS